MARMLWENVSLRECPLEGDTGGFYSLWGCVTDVVTK